MHAIDKSRLVLRLVFPASVVALATYAPTSLGQTAGTDQTVGAQVSTEELAKLKQNPVSGLRQLLFTASGNPDIPGADGSQQTYSAQLVWPIALNDQWRVVTYSILPYFKVPAPAGQDSVSGLGNTLLNFYVSPRQSSSGFVWGAGPAVVLPTRSHADLGSNRYGLGPSALLFYARDAWSAGVVLQNVWSLGGTGQNRFNTFGAQYIFNYNLNQGWFLYSNQTITADWTAGSHNRWTVPIAGGVGKIFKVGKQPISAAFQLYSNVVRPHNGPSWGWNFQLGLLFP